MSDALIGLCSLFVLFVVFGFGFWFGYRASEDAQKRLDDLLDEDK